MELCKGVEFISGQRGMGKTTYIKEKILPYEPRYLIYDHMAEFTGIKGVTYHHSLESVCDCIKRNPKGLLRAIYLTLEASEEEFSFVCRLPFSTFGLTLITDEIDQYATPISSPKEFGRLIHFGRHYGSRFIGASRRPADVSRAFTSQAQRVVSFRQTEPRDIVYLKSLCGDRADRITELNPGYCFIFESGKVIEDSISFASKLNQGQENESRQDREDSESE